MRQVILQEPGVVGDRELGAEPRPNTGEALLEIARVGLCGTDYHAFQGEQPFFRYPRVLGHELSGMVRAAGPDVDLPVGTEVAVIPYLPCGMCRACRAGAPNRCRALSVLGVHQDGGLRLSLVVPATQIYHRPGLDLDQLATLEPLAIGAHAVRRSGVTRDDVVVVVGGGPIGLGILARLRHLGVSPYLLESAPGRTEFARSWLQGVRALPVPGALEAFRETEGPDLATVVFDATGSRESMRSALEWAGPGGRVVWVGLTQGSVDIEDPMLHQRELTLMASRNATRDDFEAVAQMMNDLSLDLKRWVRRRYPATKEGLSQAFATWASGPGETGVKILLENEPGRS